jgi:hypothetical protein
MLPSLVSTLPMIIYSLRYSHWYVSGYGLCFENPATGAHESLFHDADMSASMFRIVVKSNLTMLLAVDLLRQINDVLPLLDKDGFRSVTSPRFYDVVQKVMAMKHKAAC